MEGGQTEFLLHENYSKLMSAMAVSDIQWGLGASAFCARSKIRRCGWTQSSPMGCGHAITLFGYSCSYILAHRFLVSTLLILAIGSGDTIRILAAPRSVSWEVF
jgi:hypothetical protein